jgi:hypothetical protein
MDLSTFLNPVEEDEAEVQHAQTDEQTLEEVIQEHIQEHIQESLGLREDQDNDELEQPEQPVYTIQMARQALQVVINFTEGQDNLNTAHLRAMERLEWELETLQVAARRQTTLDSWFKIM